MTLIDQAALLAAAAMLRAAGWTVTEPATNARHGCFCELDPGTEPDGCVIDEGRRQDCCYASGIERKDQCSYWRLATPEAVLAAWGGNDG